MTGCTCRITPRGETKLWGEGQRCCVGCRWIYLHITLQLHKTHPDTPRWERGEQRRGEGVQTEWCTVPKNPRWRRITTQHKQRGEREERGGKRKNEREKVVISHPCSMQGKYDFHLSSTSADKKKNIKQRTHGDNTLSSMNWNETINCYCSPATRRPVQIKATLTGPLYRKLCLEGVVSICFPASSISPSA